MYKELIDLTLFIAMESDSNLTWKYVKDVEDKKLSESYAKLMDMKYIPKDLHELFMKRSNGRPSKSLFKALSEEKVIKRVLPLDEKASGNVFKTFTSIKDRIPKNTIPFMETENGDILIMATSGTIHIWLHDKDKTVKVAKSLKEFLEKLYE